MLNEFEVLLPALPEACCTKVSYDDGTLIIKGSREDGSVSVEIGFPGIHFLGISDEGSRLRLFRDLKGVRGTIIRSRNDLVMRQFIAEGLHTLEGVKLVNYVVMLGDEIIDVISGYEPMVKLL